MRTSQPVSVNVVPGGGALPIAIVNPSFEHPPLPDLSTENNSAAIPGWTFMGTANTFVGIFNPPAGSYPEAAGQGTPIGADGAQAAYLFNNGGPAESVSAEQVMSATLQPGRSYTLSVAIGRFDPNQPYVPSTYGGYTIELLAGGSVGLPLYQRCQNLRPVGEGYALREGADVSSPAAGENRPRLNLP